MKIIFFVEFGQFKIINFLKGQQGFLNHFFPNQQFEVNRKLMCPLNHVDSPIKLTYHDNKDN